MKQFSQILSIVLHPYLLPLYGAMLMSFYTYLEILPMTAHGVLWSGIFLFSGVLPLLFRLTLRLFGQITEATQSRVRITGILLYAVFLVFASIYTRRLGLPFWGQGYLMGTAVATAVVWLTNIFGWRVSFFTAGIGALLGFEIVLSQMNMPVPIGIFIATIVACGLQGTARQKLGHNNLIEVITGWSLGLLGVLGATFALQHNLLSFI